MTWNATLTLNYSAEPLSGPAHADAPTDTRTGTPTRVPARTVARYQHSGPLRILQSLYPEGDTVCHNVLVHPPGGLVAGDSLDIQVHVGPGAHGLVTTPGATRFYKSDGAVACQQVTARLEDGARLEWLPLEALAYSGCIAANRASFDLAPSAELIGWDMTALGLPAAQQAFVHGQFSQHLEVPGVWLERGHIRAADSRLLNSPVGMAGHRCLGTLFFVSGSALPRARREAALEAVRSVIATHPLRDTAGATSPNPRVIVVRVLAPVVEPAMNLFKTLWATWRRELWGLGSQQPRTWSL
jgi:urease accessory protein